MEPAPDSYTQVFWIIQNQLTSIEKRISRVENRLWYFLVAILVQIAFELFHKYIP